jgi:hypothetical protein
MSYEDLSRHSLPLKEDFVESEKNKIYHTPSLFNLNNEVHSNKDPPQRMISFGSRVQSFGNNKISNYNSNDSPLPAELKET